MPPALLARIAAPLPALSGLNLDRPRLVGVVNVTPDSFSDGGRFLATEAAVAHALELVRQGADLLDVGGESSRPGAQPVSEEEELARVLPVLRELVRQTEVPLSLDTCKPAVARAGLEAGAHAVNDITAVGMGALADSPHVGGLLSLNLHGNPLGDEGAERLLNAPWIGGE